MPARPDTQRPAANQRRAAFLAAQKRAERRRKILLTAIPVVVVAAVVVALVAVRSSGGSGKGAAATTASSGVVSAVASVPASVFDAVGTGGLTAAPVAVGASGVPTAGGKPRVLYVGAEYCPYCAAQRWAVVAALSRFGSFSGLGQTTSAAADVYPGTATLSFHGATYTSQYLGFTGYETTTNQPRNGNYVPLDTLSSTDETLTEKYDAPPYFQGSGAIPFTMFGGRYATSGALFSPQVLQGATHADIAAALSDPGSAIGKAVVGAANIVTAAVCTTTGGQPATVCGSSGVKAAAALLPAAKASTS